MANPRLPHARSSIRRSLAGFALAPLIGTLMLTTCTALMVGLTPADGDQARSLGQWLATHGETIVSTFLLTTAFAIGASPIVYAMALVFAVPIWLLLRSLRLEAAASYSLAGAVAGALLAVASSRADAPNYYGLPMIVIAAGTAAIFWAIARPRQPAESPSAHLKRQR
jgi:uncharacterized membrane protein